MNRKTIIAAALLALAPVLTRADVTFKFEQVGSDVTMTSSGTLDTSKLVPSFFSDGWGGTGVESNGFGDIDIMGGTSFGGINTLFKFNAGTDDSAITNTSTFAGPFSFSNFNWTVLSGSKSFSTYAGFNGPRVAGIGMIASDIVGGFWTPDQNWIEYGDSFASLGLNVGTYSVSDALTGETITIQIGDSVSTVPDGGLTLALVGGSLLGLAALRRRFVA